MLSGPSTCILQSKILKKGGGLIKLVVTCLFRQLTLKSHCPLHQPGLAIQFPLIIHLIIANYDDSCSPVYNSLFLTNWRLVPTKWWSSVLLHYQIVDKYSLMRITRLRVLETSRFRLYFLWWGDASGSGGGGWSEWSWEWMFLGPRVPAFTTSFKLQANSTANQEMFVTITVCVLTD